MRLTAYWAAQKSQGHDPQAHIFVDASEPDGFNLNPGLFCDLSHHSVLWRLIEFQDSSRWNPSTIISTLDCKDTSVTSLNNTRHTD